MATNEKPIISFSTEENAETKILQMLSEAYPNLDCGPGTPVYEMVVRPLAYLWSRQSTGIEEMVKSVGLEDYVHMEPEDLDRLMSRYFLTRRVGKNVEGIVRCMTKGKNDIVILAGEIWETAEGKTYEVLSNHTIKVEDFDDLTPDGHYIHKITDDAEDYYLDVPVLSTGVGNLFNANKNDAVTVTGQSAEYITAAFFLSNTSDGGSTETNYEFFNRGKNELAFRGMCSYKSTSALLLENFDNITQVVSVGLRDSEMIRDLYPIRMPGATEDIQVHIGGTCDVYVKPATYYAEPGYIAPLGFPVQCFGSKLNPALTNIDVGFINAWNQGVLSKAVYIANSTGMRGSTEEQIEGLSEGDLVNIKGDITEVSNFVRYSDNASLHTDNLVKQMWPIVVTANVIIESDNPDEDKALAKITLSEYINSLKTTEAPQAGEIAHILRNVGIRSIHFPMRLYAYYLTDGKTLSMEAIGLHGEAIPAPTVKHIWDPEKQEYIDVKEYHTLLIPREDDSLAFDIREQSQISLRTCTWYTNPDLINIEVVNA